MNSSSISEWSQVDVQEEEEEEEEEEGEEEGSFWEIFLFLALGRVTNWD